MIKKIKMFYNFLMQLMGKKPNELKRAMWIWNIDFKEINNLIRFCKENKINIIYLHNNLKNPELLKEAIDRMKKRGLAVKYLLGDSTGRTAGSLITEAETALKLKIFDGVHYDIEQGDEELNKFIGKYKLVLEENNGEADIETWQTGQNYYNLFRKCPSVTLMSYYNDAYRIIRDVNRFGRKLNRPFFIGVETQRLDKAGISFNSFTREEMLRELKRVEDYFLYDKNFLGFAFHYYQSFKEMGNGA